MFETPLRPASAWMSVAAVMIAMFLACGCANGSAASEGRVSGLVAGSPAYPIGNQARPQPDATVEFVSTGKSDGSTSVKTGSDGRYSTRLSAGSYEVRLLGFNAVQLYYGRNPETYGKWPRVTVVAGSEVHLDLIFDSGIQ
jgi:hypothetical protein